MICSCLLLSSPISCHIPPSLHYLPSTYANLPLCSQVIHPLFQGPSLHHTSLPWTPIPRVPSLLFFIIWIKLFSNRVLIFLYSSLDYMSMRAKTMTVFVFVLWPLAQCWNISQPPIHICCIHQRNWVMPQFSSQHCAFSLRNIYVWNPTAVLQIKCQWQSKSQGK